MTYIEKLASAVHDYISGTDLSTPVDFSNAVEHSLGISIYFCDGLNNAHGVIKIHNHQPKLLISNDLDYYQQDYVIAKLLGYLVLEWKFTPNKKLPNTLMPLHC